MKTRRDFIKMSAVAGTAIAGATVATSSLARLPDPVIQTSPDTATTRTYQHSLAWSASTKWYGWCGGIKSSSSSSRKNFCL